MIEINLRCRLANHFSTKYSVLGYKDAANFTSGEIHEVFLQELQREVIRSRSPFVRNFQNNYENGEIPFYALVEIMSFGMLSKFYKNMKGEDKKQVASLYGINYRYLESWIESISNVRNICAHYGRIYNTKLTKMPMLYTTDTAKGVTNQRIFGVLCCMRRLLSENKSWKDFVDKIEQLFSDHTHVILDTMGFTEDWKEILLSE